MEINQIPVKQTGSELTAEEFNAVVDQVKANIEDISQIVEDIELLETETITKQEGTTIAVGGIPKNTILYGDTAKAVLEKMLFQELFPTSITAPTYSFSINPSGLQEVGSVVNVTKTRTFNRGTISPQYQSASPYRSGPVIDYTEVGNEGNFTVVLGTTSWKSKANYGAGVQPKGSSGTDMPNTPPLPAGTSNEVTATITGVYPVYATTSLISTYTKQPLKTHGSDIIVDLVAEGAVNKQTVKIPEAWGNITKLYIKNLSGGYDQTEISNFTVTNETINSVNYKVYTHNGTLTGQRNLKFTL